MQYAYLFWVNALNCLIYIPIKFRTIELKIVISKLSDKENLEYALYFLMLQFIT